MTRWRFAKEILHRLLCRSRQGQRRADLTESAHQEHRPSLCRLDGRERVQGLAMASPETICLRRRQLRRRVDEDRVNSTATRRLVHKRRRNIHRNLADEVLQGRGIAVLRRSDRAGCLLRSRHHNLLHRRHLRRRHLHSRQLGRWWHLHRRWEYVLASLLF